MIFNIRNLHKEENKSLHLYYKGVFIWILSDGYLYVDYLMLKVWFYINNKIKENRTISVYLGK